MSGSAAKKKIDASATITNTMMVVIIVSRRVGQVTLLVSERTSCRNLNGLKAILDTIRVVRRWFKNPNSPLAPSPLVKVEPASGLDVWGISKPRRISVSNGPAAGGRYVLRAKVNVKAGGTGKDRIAAARLRRNRAGR